MLHFPREEFDRRLKAARQELSARDLDALLIFAQETHYYLTGFDTGGYKFFQCAVLTTEASAITLLTRKPDLHQARITSTIEDIRVWYDAEGANPAVELRHILEEKGLRGKRLGVELATYGLTGANWELLRHALEGFCELVDASTVVHMQRAVKSALELTYVRQAAKLADDAIIAMLETAAPGVHESRVEAAICDAVLTGDGDLAGAKVIFGSGPKAVLTRSSSGGRTLCEGDQFVVEWSGIYRRYNAGIFRTVAIGKAKPQHKEIFGVTLDALAAMTEAAKPGSPLGLIDQAQRDVFDRADFSRQRQSTAGYSVGATFPPRGLPDYPPLLYAGNPLVAQPGMTLFLHAVFADERTGAAMMLGHTVVITEHSNEVLSKLNMEYTECL